MTSSLIKKKVIVGITGGIAAYKAADLVHQLYLAGAEVRVVMTRAAQTFIVPLTLQALSGFPVLGEDLPMHSDHAMDHITLARWADLVVIAPATADFIARMAYGHADDLLSTLCLATQAPIAVAPAMNQAMWQHPLTQQNIARLHTLGVLVWGPDHGRQACGDMGPGRMVELSTLLSCVANHFSSGHLLSGQHCLITAGPTQEAIDPVRFLSNRSSGKMGYALARAALEYGALVTLVSGPTALSLPENAECVQVTNALEMSVAVMAHIEKCTIFIAAAAVADYRPVVTLSQKLKKSEQTFTLQLERNPDILQKVATLSLPCKPLLVGFAAETENVLGHAREKLQKKNLDMIIANQVGQGQGFEADENAVTVLKKDGSYLELPLMPKTMLAKKIMDLVAQAEHEKRQYLIDG